LANERYNKQLLIDKERFAMKFSRTNPYLALVGGALLIAVMVLGGDTAQSGTTPAGVQEDVLLSTIPGIWSGNQIYRDNYNVDSVSIADMFNGHGDYIMLGAIQDDSSTIDLLAATTWTVVPRVRHAM